MQSLETSPEKRGAQGRWAGVGEGAAALAGLLWSRHTTALEMGPWCLVTFRSKSRVRLYFIYTCGI